MSSNWVGDKKSQDKKREEWLLWVILECVGSFHPNFPLFILPFSPAHFSSPYRCHDLRIFSGVASAWEFKTLVYVVYDMQRILFLIPPFVQRDRFGWSKHGRERRKSYILVTFSSFLRLSIATGHNTMAYTTFLTLEECERLKEKVRYQREDRC